MTKTERNLSKWNYIRRVFKKGGKLTELLVKFIPYKGQKSSVLVKCPLNETSSNTTKMHNKATTTVGSQKIGTVRNNGSLSKTALFLQKLSYMLKSLKINL